MIFKPKYKISNLIKLIIDFDEELDSKKGLELGTFAPIIDTKDIYGNKINTSEILKEYNEFLIDFFRGAF